MTAYSRDELFALAASYALGATSADETAAVEAAIPDSPDLAAEVASFREVVGELAQLTPVVPSPAVRERLLQRIHRPPVAVKPSDRTVIAQVPRRSFVRGPAIAAAAAILVVAGMGAESLLLARRNREADAARILLTAALENRETTLNTLLHAEKDLRVIHLKAADTVKGPGIQFFWNEKHHMGVAHAFRLPPAPPQHAYQLWTIVDGHPRSVKVFDSDPDGHALVENLTLPPTSHGTTAIYVTVEPAGGSTAPTTEPLLKGSVPASY
jgi:anti-sigma-K factor RskA